jgi:hypothetical protein
MDAADLNWDKGGQGAGATAQGIGITRPGPPGDSPAGDVRQPVPGLDQLVFYLPDAEALERITARLAAAGVHPVAQIDYWQDNGGVTYQDPDGRKVVFASWIYRPPS